MKYESAASSRGNLHKWSTNSHAEQAGCIMLQEEIFVRKSFGAINAGAASTIAVEKVSTLDHELSDLRSIRCDNPLQSPTTEPGT